MTSNSTTDTTLFRAAHSHIVLYCDTPNRVNDRRLVG